MKMQAILFVILSFSSAVFAADLNLETEDVSSESDAAMAENKSVKENLAKEREQAARAHKAADEVRQNAEQKKQNAIDEMKKSESEIQSLTAEQAKIKDDVEKMKLETGTASKTLQENKLKLEKARAEVLALQQLRNETNKKLLDIAAETDKTALELKALEHGKTQAAADFQQVKEDSKAAGDKLAKMKEELQQKQAQAAIAAQNASPTPAAPVAAAPVVPAAAADLTSAAVDSTAMATGAAAPFGASTGAPAAAPEIQRAVTSVSAADSAAADAAEMKLKKDCKIYDRTTKDPQVIGTKFNGTSVLKTEETKYWIGFALSPQQKGFVAKTCF